MCDSYGQDITLMLPLNHEQVLNALTTDSKLSKPLSERLSEDIKTLKRKVSSEISRGIANNFSYTEIAKNLRGVSNVGMNNAYIIARTEDHRIQNQSSMDAANKAKDNGADVVKQWDATLDSRTRPLHALLDGQIRELDKPFEIAGRKAMYPSGLGIASEDILCRCTLLQRAKCALDDGELQTLKERAEFYWIDKTKDFDDFKSKYLENISQ
ncbi:MAG: minor capsid protein [Bacilli bacterium]|nr:minor capsid protein [Bacilli bacterium]